MDTLKTSKISLYEALQQVAANCDREKYFNQHQDRYKMVLDRVAPYKTGSKVLDVGAAPGHLAMALAYAGYDVHGIVYDLNEDWEDTSAANLQFKTQAQNCNLTLAQCDIQNQPFPYPDNSFDLFIFTEVLEHLWLFPGKVVEEIFRVLKPGGRVILTTPNATSLKNRIRWIVGKTSYTNLETMLSLPVHMRHNREYTLKEVEQLLKRVRFNLLETGCHEWHIWTTRKPGRHAYEERFKLNSKRQLVKLGLLPVTLLVPWTRGGLILVGEKSQTNV